MLLPRITSVEEELSQKAKIHGESEKVTRTLQKMIHGLL